MLLLPDLLNYFLTGVKATEYSITSTTQYTASTVADVSTTHGDYVYVNWGMW